MSKSRHSFSGIHPEAYRSFRESGWQDVQFSDSSTSPVALLATNANGEEITIKLPTRPGVTIPDRAMLDLLRANAIKLRPLEVDWVLFELNWNLTKSAASTGWLEKAHRVLPDNKVYINTKAKFPGDVLVRQERLGQLITSKRLEELDNLYLLSDYLISEGYPPR
jgi:hypothetical protein